MAKPKTSQTLLQRIFINRDYGLLFMGRLVSQIGDGIHYFALAWLVLDLTGSGTALGTLLMVSSLPGILLTPFSGVLADRLDRKKIVVYADVVRGLITLALGFIYYNDALSMPVLYAATVLISLCGVLFGPAISATIPGLVKKEELVQANARDSLSNSATGIVGPIIGALLLGAFGYFGIFMVNGTSFLLSAFSETFIRFPRQTKMDHGDAKGRVLSNFGRDFKEGLHYIWSNAGLRTLILFAVAINFLFNPMFSVVLPYFSKEVLQMDAQIYGFIQSSFPAGILLGTLTVGFLTSKMKKNKLMAVGIGGEGFLTALISLFAIPLVYQGLTATTVALLMALPIFFMGALNVQVNVPFMTMMQETVPENYRGRVFGLFGSMVTMFTPVSMALAGVLVDVVPTFYFLAIAGGLTLSLGFAIGASKNISGMFDEQAPDTHSFSPAKETLS